MTTIVEKNEARTANGMKALETTTDKVVDLFFKIGASRGKDIIPTFTDAYFQNKELALKVALWARDVRGGSGERKVFRDILTHLETIDVDAAKSLIDKTVELGRWDDVFSFNTPKLQQVAFNKIKSTLVEGMKAKVLLNKIDTMSEDDCADILASLR